MTASARRAVLAAGVAAALAPLLLGGCAAGPFIGPAADPDLARLRSVRFVLLGEVHDNAEQHRERAALLRGLLADGRPSHVVFEQIDRGHDAAIAAAPRDADAVAAGGRLDRRGWRWPLHAPLFEAALDAGATLRGGNLDRGAARAVVRDGLAAAPAPVRELLERAPWTPAQQQALQRWVDAGHCGALPASQLAPMALAQRARDAALAEALLGTPAGARAVLVAGNGHVRTDLGVPHYLRAAGVPAREIVAVGFVEAGDGDDAPYDLRRVGPPAERADPCASLR